MKKNLVKKIIIRVSLVFILLFVLVLLPAGTFHYWQVYLYAGILIIPLLLVVYYFLKNNPEFLERRMKFRENEKEQKKIQWIFSLFLIAGFVISGLDKRFSWSAVPVWMVIVADFLIFASYLMIFFVFKQNSYASRIVIVEERQKLITTGLYGIVRHPMYTGVMVMYLLTPVALGSFRGLIPMAVIPLSLVMRIANEEKLLRSDLDGYIDYCLKVKYRMIPYVW